MSITAYYQHILETMPEDLTRKVFAELTRHVGEDNKISLRDLTLRVQGKYTTSTERKVRLAIATLRDIWKVAVCSESGKNGRWLAANEGEREACLREMYNRKESLDQVIRGIEEAIIPVDFTMFNPRPATDAKQISLF